MSFLTLDSEQTVKTAAAVYPCWECCLLCCFM
jgi:hypothetical protein